MYCYYCSSISAKIIFDFEHVFMDRTMDTGYKKEEEIKMKWQTKRSCVKRLSFDILMAKSNLFTRLSQENVSQMAQDCQHLKRILQFRIAILDICAIREGLQIYKARL